MGKGIMSRKTPTGGHQNQPMLPVDKVSQKQKKMARNASQAVQLKSVSSSLTTKLQKKKKPMAPERTLQLRSVSGMRAK